MRATKRTVCATVSIVFVVLLAAVVALAVVAGTRVPAGSGPRGTMSFVVLDTNNNAISGARVSMICRGGSARTNASGVARFNNLRVGNYTFHVEANGFATESWIRSISLANEGGMGRAVANSPTYEIQLTPTSASIRGATYIQSNDTMDQRLSGVALTLEFPTLVNTIFTTTTDAYGNFAFENLPANRDFVLRADTLTQNGLIHTATMVSDTTYAHGTFAAQEHFMTFRPNADLNPFYYIAFNTRLATRNQPITIHFNRPVDVPRTTFTDGGILSQDGILIMQEWNATYTSVTIRPVGEWFLTGYSITTITLPGIIWAKGAELFMDIRIHDTFPPRRPNIVLTIEEQITITVPNDVTGLVLNYAQSTILNNQGLVTADDGNVVINWYAPGTVPGRTFVVKQRQPNGAFIPLGSIVDVAGGVASTSINLTRAQINQGVEIAVFEVRNTVMSLNPALLLIQAANA